MAYQQNLCNYYENLIEEAAEKIIQRLVRSWIRQLQKIKREDGIMQSPEDSGLKNLWDDICSQMQKEKSFFWQHYEEYLYNMIYSQLEKRCSQNELEILWCQTEQFKELAEMEEEGNICEKDSAPWKTICTEELVSWCLSELLEAAGNYRNERITEYIEY